MSDIKGKPCIICVAITGSLPTKANTPAEPISITEQIDSTQEAFEAGASIAHCHVRNDDESPSSDPAKFAALKEGIEKHCPGMIVQLSTGGRSGAGHARGGMHHLLSRYGRGVGFVQFVSKFEKILRVAAMAEQPGITLALLGIGLAGTQDQPAADDQEAHHRADPRLLERRDQDAGRPQEDERLDVFQWLSDRFGMLIAVGCLALSRYGFGFTSLLADNIASSSWWQPSVRYKGKDVFGSTEAFNAAFAAKYKGDEADYIEAASAACGAVLEGSNAPCTTAACGRSSSPTAAGSAPSARWPWCCSTIRRPRATAARRPARCRGA